jgi:hypothetical protein
MVIGGGVAAFFILRDMFRFGRQRIPFPLLAGIVLLFTGVGYVVAGYAGPILGASLLIGDLLGRWTAKRSVPG